MSFPALHGNWVDFCLFSFALFYLLGNLRRGLVLGLIDFSGFLFSFILAFKFYGFFGQLLIANFTLPKGIAQAIGFFLVFLLSEFLFSLILRVTYPSFYFFCRKKIKKRPFLSFLNLILGLLPSLGEAALLAAFFLSLILTLPISGAIKKEILASKIGSRLVFSAQHFEKELKAVFGQAIEETLNFLTITANPLSGEKIELHFTQSKVEIKEEEEREMFFLVNKEREKRGLKKLEFSPPLQELARDYGKKMFAWGYFSHYDLQGLSPFDRMERAGIKFRVGGENLALAPNVNLAHQGLMNSPGHRANILSSDFGKVGIGVIDGGIYGEIFVQEFTD